ncbi:hypothetical protein D0Z08_06825 [Nocardioides immobilis]|uniref:Uncharacterized protein n=1 Tax=Nocardioides immobilis TaxID=2049295 RepID=A0A417Y5Y9_9ACTN|nr:hypothetical protein D0Z08_06825 [Nocardioides immobilis]
MSAGILVLAVAPAPGSQADDEGRGEGSPVPQRAERSVRVTKSGVVVQTVRVGESTVTTYGPDAPPVTVTQRGKSATARLSVEPSPRSRRSLDPTVFEMTLASGHFSREEACEFAKAIDPRGCVTSATLRSREVAAPRDGRRTAARSDFLDTRCWTLEHEPGDGTKYNYNCNYRRMDFLNQKLWLISNRMQATGWEEEGGTCCDYLQGVGVRAEYEDSAAHAVEWSPGETRAIEDSCRSTTTSVTSSRTGTSYSVTNEICPEELSPWHSPAFQYFGAKWTGPGAPHEDRRGAIATSLVRVDRPGTRAYALAAWLKWG